MPRPLTTLPCIDCGQPTTRRLRRDHPFVCYSCGERRMIEHNTRLSREHAERRAADARRLAAARGS